MSTKIVKAFVVALMLNTASLMLVGSAFGAQKDSVGFPAAEKAWMDRASQINAGGI